MMKRYTISQWARVALTLLLVAAMLPVSAMAAGEAEKTVITAKETEIVVGVGKRANVSVAVTPAKARQKGLTYAISDETVATVKTNGAVTGVAIGACELTITSRYDPSVSITLPVTVVVPVKKITAAVEQNKLYVGSTLAITAAFEPEDATLKKAVYTSAKETVATVDENGVITGVGRGSTQITVQSVDGNAKAKINVQVLQQPQSIALSASANTVVVGRSLAVRSTVLPQNADNKRLTWSSSDESVMTVGSSGRVAAKAPGTAIITATSVENPSLTGSLTLTAVRLAKSVAFDQKTYGVKLTESAQLSVTVSPEDTSNKAVTYRSNRPKIVSVDENGVVTALAPGKATITAKTADGSRREATTVVEVIVPVTGVHFDQHDIRVGANYHGTFTATLEPKEATNKNMTWVISDESVATVSGTTNRVRISGRRWGRCQLTGTTEDGGYTCSVYVDIGSLSRAVTVESVKIQDGRARLVFKNNSDMNITHVDFRLTGTDEYGNPIVMNGRDSAVAYGKYEHPLAPGEKTRHGEFTFHNSTNWNMQSLSVAITGWSTDTGYYGHDGALYYTYNLSSNNYAWHTYTTDLYDSTPKAE